MKIIRSGKAKRYEPQPGWKRVSLCAENAISIEHFTKPAHHASPMHCHEAEQVLVLLTGSLVIRTQKGFRSLSEGDCAFLESNEPHSVINDSDEDASGLDIFAPGRSFDFWQNRISDETES